MSNFHIGLLILLALLAAGLEVASESPESPALPPDVRVYEVGKTVAEFPEEEDFSTPESAYAVVNRVLAAGGSGADWARISVKELRARLVGTPQQKRDVPPEVARQWLSARIVEVRIFREKHATVLAEVTAERTHIDFRSLELEEGKWLNRGQSIYGSLEEARLAFARRCARLIGKPARPGVENPEAYLKPFVEFLKTTGEEPRAFVVRALAAHKVVIMGEIHHRPWYWAFNSSLVTHPEFPKLVGTIYMELPSNDQGLVDEFLAGKGPDPKLIIEMLRDNLWMGWPDQPMLDFFVTVWMANQDLAPEQRLRIVLVDMQRPWKDIQERSDWRQYERPPRDRQMADNILRDLHEHPEEKRHALFTVGVGHAMLDHKYFEGSPVMSAGWYLRNELGRENVYAIFPHMPVQTNWGRVDGRLCLGLFDSAFAELGNQPVAFPLKAGPFGEQPFDAMPDSPVAGAYRDGYDAYLYLGPLEDEVFSPLIPGFYTDDFVQELERRTRVMWGKPWSEAYRQKPNAESFIAWMRNSWGQPRKWTRSLGPENAWQYGDNWKDEIAKQRRARALDDAEAIIADAEKLFEAIRSADYENPGDWRHFPGGREYCVYTNYSGWMKWVCDNFKKNPMQTVEFGETFKGDGRTPYKVTFGDGTVREGQFSKAEAGLPTVPYKLTLEDGTVIEGNLPFRYYARGDYWMGVHGLDWHLIEPSLDLSPAAEQTK